MQVKVVPNYYEYIKTEEWRAKREEVFKKYGKACVCCKSKENIEVHHCTYVNLGFEAVTDLRPLCKECHGKVHELGGGYAGIRKLKRSRSWQRRHIRKQKRKTTKWKGPTAKVEPRKFVPKTIIRKGHGPEIVKVKA